jgi:hypothetical protein
MFHTKVKAFYVMLTVAALTALGCVDSQFERDPSPVYGIQDGNGGRDVPEGLVGNPDGRYPYPEIIEREYIPPYDLFSNYKCLAWRITWPTYEAGVDPEKIPTVFSHSTGLLNSIWFLNNTSPGNTYKGKFSLYYGNKVESANTMWSELTYSFGAGNNMETTYFAKKELPLENIIEWVTERPDLFKQYWPGSSLNDIEYEEGDFILYQIEESNQFGGIRIVSMTPRIIEVYLRVPNL